MFTAIKAAFSGVFTKVLFAALIAVGSLALWNYMQANDAQKKLITSEANYKAVKGKYDTLKTDYANLEKQLEQKQASGQVDQNVTTHVNNTTIIYRDRFDLVDKKVEEKVTSIRKKYAAMEQSEANKRAQDQEVSAVRVGGLWGSFCANQPNHPTCVADASAKAVK